MSDIQTDASLQAAHKLHIYNTMSGEKAPFLPIDDQNIKMYVCGPTVYNYIHIGNARPIVVFDTLFRVLSKLYPNVTYARNITDIDDKIMKAAAEQGVSIDDISQKYTKEFHQDAASLNALPPTITPLATQHLDVMQSMVQKLVDEGHAYEAEGNVLFDVKSMKNYGELSNRNLDDMLDGARVEVASYKRYAGDFVLWKPSASNEPGWDSPWGRGRPGWHLECSAMIEKHLGDSIDIHGGGRDLVFPHHENEKAQSECAHGGTEYVRYWMHNGYININGEKMAKSLGNFITVRTLLEDHHGEVIRFALLSAHYRSELEFSDELMQQSKASLDTLYGALRKLPEITLPRDTDLACAPAFKALTDDLNTSLAISELHALAKTINRTQEIDDDALRAGQLIKAVGGLMGILNEAPDGWFQGANADTDAERIEALIQEREAAKRSKNYQRADDIRTQLKEEGIVLEDSREGTQWRRE